MYSIKVQNQKVMRLGSIEFNLEITGDLPVFLGCTVLINGIEYDKPGQWAKSHQLPFHVNMIATAPKKRGDWNGKIMFALWRDESFSERLADTGWIKWTN